MCIRDSFNEFIYGDETMKMLGFVFGRRPNANAHIEYIRRKFYKKLWVLRHIKKATKNEELLVKIYCVYLRPVIEYLSVVYHCLIGSAASSDLERLQATSLKIIYGFNISYKKCLEKSGIKSLEDRRIAAIDRFALNTIKNNRFKNWFPTNPTKITRRTEKYEKRV